MLEIRGDKLLLGRSCQVRQLKLMIIILSVCGYVCIRLVASARVCLCVLKRTVHLKINSNAIYQSR